MVCRGSFVIKISPYKTFLLVEKGVNFLLFTILLYIDFLRDHVIFDARFDDEEMK